MNLERFTALIDAYGCDPRRWPDHERQAAQALVAASTEAQHLMREAAAFDALLPPPLEIAPSAALKARILAQVTPRAATATTWRAQIAEALALLFPAGRAMPQFAALALALAIGIGAGLANIGVVDLQDEDLIVLQLAAANPVHLEE